jgi:flagellar export protein FliJ
MAPFTFRLESVLRLRRALRDQRRAELARAAAAEQVLLERLQQLAQQRAANAQHRRTCAGVLDVDGLIAAARYDAVLQAQHAALSRQLEAVRDELRRRQQHVVEAGRDVQVLQRLRERYAAEHRQRLESLQIRDLDEVAARQHQREDRP